MEFGLFSLFDFFRDRQDEVAYYRDTLDLILLSEKLGFDSVWLGEEHFYSFGICPSPQMFLDGSRTRDITHSSWHRDQSLAVRESAAQSGRLCHARYLKRWATQFRCRSRHYSQTF